MKRLLRLHLAGVIAVPGCLAAGWFELSRARAGNALSWSYTVQWPVFAAVVVYVWVRLAREFRAEATGTALVRAEVPAAAPAPREALDPGLRDWQEYVHRLHLEDPPGGPPR